MNLTHNNQRLDVVDRQLNKMGNQDTAEALSKVLVWCSDSILPSNKINFAIINYWWSTLNGKMVRWDIFSSMIKSTTPLLKDVTIIENPSINGKMLCWRKQGLENFISMPVEHLVLDYQFQELIIIPTSQDWFVSQYRLQVLE